MSTRVIQLDIFQAGFRDDSDVVVNGGSVEFYTADQTYTTPKNAYTTKDKSATLTSVTLNANGAYPTGLYFDGATVYDFRLKDSGGNIIRNYPNVKIPDSTFNQRTVTANTTATLDDDLILGNTTSGPITVTLYQASTSVKPISIKNTQTSAITVVPHSGELIDGASSATITSGAAKDLYSDGSQWFTVITSAGVTQVTSTDGTVVLDGGTDGSDATFTGTASIATTVADLAITTAKLAASAVTTAKIADDAVDKDKIAADVAGVGLGQNADGSLESLEYLTYTAGTDIDILTATPSTQTVWPSYTLGANTGVVVAQFTAKAAGTLRISITRKHSLDNGTNGYLYAMVDGTSQGSRSSGVMNLTFLTITKDVTVVAGSVVEIALNNSLATGVTSWNSVVVQVATASDNQEPQHWDFLYKPEATVTTATPSVITVPTS